MPTLNQLPPHDASSHRIARIGALCRYWIVLLLSMPCFTATAQSSPQFESAYKVAGALLFSDLEACHRSVDTLRATNKYDSLRLLHLRANVYLYEGKFDSSRRICTDVTGMYKATEDTSLEVCNIINTLGETYKEQINDAGDERNYDSARMYYESVLTALPVIKTRLRMAGRDTFSAQLLAAKVYNNLGEVAIFAGQYKEADMHLRKALATLAPYDDSESRRVRGYVYESMGMSYEEQGVKDSALAFYQRSYAIRQGMKQAHKYEFILISYRLWRFHELHPAYSTPGNAYFNDIQAYAQQYSPGIIFRISRDLIKSVAAQMTAKRQSEIRYISFCIVLLAGLLTLIYISGVAIRARKRKELLSEQRQLLIEQLNAANEQLQQLNVLGEEISTATSEKDLPAFIDRIYDSINRLVDAPVVIIGIINHDTGFMDFYGREEGKALSTYASRSIDDPNSLLVECYKNATEKIIDNYGDTQYNRALPEEGITPESMAVFPLMGNQDTIGVISMQSANRAAYSKSRAVMTNMVSKIAIAIDIILKNDKLFRANARLNTVLWVLRHDIKPICETGLRRLDEAAPGHATEETGVLADIKKHFTGINELFSLTDNMGSISQDFEIDVMPGLVVLSELLEVIWQRVRTAYHEQNIDIEVNVVEDRSFVSDKGILTFIVSNLISNAYKAIQARGEALPAGKITIAAHVDDEAETLTISVADNGVGMPGEQAANFFKKKVAAKTFIQGEGVALKICQGMLNSYNRLFRDRLGSGQLSNNIVVSSEGLGMGCKFTLVVPVSVG